MLGRARGSRMLALCAVCAVRVQANALAVQAARTCPTEVLAVQLLQLRQCVDALYGQLRSAGAAHDPIERLRAKQQLRGRERQARMPLNSEC